MALPIKETPILRGKDAEKFMAQLKTSKKRKVSSKDYKRAMDTYRRVIDRGITL